MRAYEVEEGQPLPDVEAGDWLVVYIVPKSGDFRDGKFVLLHRRSTDGALETWTWSGHMEAFGMDFKWQGPFA